MWESGIAHDRFTFPIANRAVSALNGDAIYGGMIHAVAMKMGFGSRLHFCNTMIDAYCKVRKTDWAAKVFEGRPHRDLVSWTTMISGWLSGGSAALAVELFKAMRFEFDPNSATMIILLRGCCTLEGSALGRQLHGLVVKSGLLSDAFVRNSVLRMYTGDGKSEEVRKFADELDEKDIVSNNILISFFSSRGDTERVADLFNEIQWEVSLTAEIITSVVSALTNFSNENLTIVEKLHCLTLKYGLCDFVLMTSLLELYSKFRLVGSSVKLFEEIPHKTSITWNVMMSGFIHNGHFQEAIGVFKQMLAAGLVSRSLIDAYAYIGALQAGKEVHGYLIRNSMKHWWKEHTPLNTSIINMYLRCGDIASRIWGAVLAGSRTYGDRKVGEFAAQRLLELEKDNVGYNTLFSNIQANGGNWSRAELLRQEMKEKDLKKRPGWSCLMGRGRIHGFVSGDRLQS